MREFAIGQVWEVFFHAILLTHAPLNRGGEGSGRWGVCLQGRKRDPQNLGIWGIERGVAKFDLEKNLRTIE